MRHREFITLVGIAAAPIVRVAALTPSSESGAEVRSRLSRVD